MGTADGLLDVEPPLPQGQRQSSVQLISHAGAVTAGVQAANAQLAKPATDHGTATPTPDATVILGLYATVLSHPGFSEATTALATELANVFRAERVSIGMNDGGHSEVAAVSGETGFESRADIFAAIGAAMDEAIEQGVTITYPCAADEKPRITLAHAALARRSGAVLRTMPLVYQARAIGAMTLEWREAGTSDKAAATVCEPLAGLLGPILQLKYDASLRWHRRIARGIKHGYAQTWQPGHVGVKLAALFAFAAIVGLCSWPTAYRISAPARIEGSIQRALVAPAEGFLRQAHVKAGDVVAADQILAELADQDLEIERRKWASEMVQHENSSRAALARGERTQYVVFLGKASEARAQLDLVAQQLARGRVRAPFDGIIIKGDLSQTLGAPVQRGDVLFTIAPLRQFRLLVDVDERDIRDVRQGATGEVALAALPGETVSFHVTRVTPVATAKEGRNFYEIEAQLSALPDGLRPGLQGVAKIRAADRSLVWIWGHRFIDWLRLTLWSLGS